MAEKRVSTCENVNRNLQNGKVRRKERLEKKKKNRLSKNYGETTSHVTYVSQEYQKDKKKKGVQEICEAIMTERFSQINVRHQTTDPRSS